MTLDPSEYTVRDLRDELDAVDDPAELQEIRQAELNAKNRKTARAAIDRRLDAVGDGEAAETEATADAEAGGSPEAEQVGTGDESAGRRDEAAGSPAEAESPTEGESADGPADGERLRAVAAKDASAARERLDAMLSARR